VVGAWMGFLGALGAAAGCPVPRTRKYLVACHGVLAPASGQRCILWSNNEPEGTDSSPSRGLVRGDGEPLCYLHIK
jgi:hypothetical protein